MEIDSLERSNKLQRSLGVFLLILVISAFLAVNSSAKTAKEIDASVNVAIKRFYKQVAGAEEFVKASKGMLVMPNVVKGTGCFEIFHIDGIFSSYSASFFEPFPDRLFR